MRRLLYPLFLPAIVVTVWAHAWAAKVDAARARLPAGDATAHFVAIPSGVQVVHPALAEGAPEPGWTPEDGLTRDDTYASTADEDTDDKN